MKKISLVTLAATALVACGPSLTMNGARVKVEQNAPPATCNLINTVDSEAGSSEAAEVGLRNKAGEAMANAVVISEKVDNGGRVRLVGKAYTCKADDPAASPNQ